jgi:hypothetical protein
MNKSAWWAWAIRNSVCVICWTTLAIVLTSGGYVFSPCYFFVLSRLTL